MREITVSNNAQLAFDVFDSDKPTAAVRPRRQQDRPPHRPRATEIGGDGPSGAQPASATGRANAEALPHDAMHGRRLLHTVKEAAYELGIGRTKVFALIRSGELQSIRIGAARRIPDDASLDFIRRQRRCSPARPQTRRAQ
jgi:excisionase family DNA binding protein